MEMQKYVKQFRYYRDGDIWNTNDALNEGLITGDKLVNGNIFGNLQIIQLSIQSIPGVEFYLNTEKDNKTSRNGIKLGESGIYEIDVKDLGYIMNISFTQDSVDILTQDCLHNGYFATGLIIDVMYEENSSKTTQKEVK